MAVQQQADSQVTLAECFQSHRALAADRECSCQGKHMPGVHDRQLPLSSTGMVTEK